MASLRRRYKGCRVEVRLNSFSFLVSRLWGEQKFYSKGQGQRFKGISVAWFVVFRLWLLAGGGVKQFHAKGATEQSRKG